MTNLKPIKSIAAWRRIFMPKPKKEKCYHEFEYRCCGRYCKYCDVAAADVEDITQ